MFFRFSFDCAAAAMRQSVLASLLFFVASPSLSQELKEFSNGEVADADDVNFNFALLKDAIDALALEPTSTIITAEGPPSGDTRFEFMDSVQLLNGETHFLITYQL